MTLILKFQKSSLFTVKVLNFKVKFMIKKLPISSLETQMLMRFLLAIAGLVIPHGLIIWMKMLKTSGKNCTLTILLKELIICMELGMIWTSHLFSKEQLKSNNLACQWIILTFKLMELLFNTGGYIMLMEHFNRELHLKDFSKETIINWDHSYWLDPSSLEVKDTLPCGLEIVKLTIKMFLFLSTCFLLLVSQVLFLVVQMFQASLVSPLMISLFNSIN